MKKKRNPPKDQRKPARLINKQSWRKRLSSQYPTLLEQGLTKVMWEGEPTDEEIRKGMGPEAPSDMDLFDSDPKVLEKLSKRLTISYDDENILIRFGEDRKIKVPFSNLFRIPSTYKTEIPESQLRVSHKMDDSDDEEYKRRQFEGSINVFGEKYIGGRSEKTNLKILKGWIDNNGILPIPSEKIRQIALDINRKLVYLVNNFIPGVKIPSFSRFFLSEKITLPGSKKPKRVYRLKFQVIPSFGK